MLKEILPLIYETKTQKSNITCTEDYREINIACTAKYDSLNRLIELAESSKDIRIQFEFYAYGCEYPVKEHSIYINITVKKRDDAGNLIL